MTLSVYTPHCPLSCIDTWCESCLSVLQASGTQRYMSGIKNQNKPIICFNSNTTISQHINLPEKAQKFSTLVPYANLAISLNNLEIEQYGKNSV